MHSLPTLLMACTECCVSRASSVFLKSGAGAVCGLGLGLGLGYGLGQGLG